jgi:hypothetical protein
VLNSGTHCFFYVTIKKNKPYREGIFMKDDKDLVENQEEETDLFEKELDQVALDVIKRLYDKTFKELVDR